MQPHAETVIGEVELSGAKEGDKERKQRKCFCC